MAITCETILKSGNRKGEACGKVACKIHMAVSVTNVVSTPVVSVHVVSVPIVSTPVVSAPVVSTPVVSCSTILKSGKRKGEVCGKEQCKLHQSTENIPAPNIPAPSEPVVVLFPVSVPVSASVPIETINTCETILKTGQRKGQRCGKVSCGLHKTVQCVSTPVVSTTPVVSSSQVVSARPESCCKILMNGERAGLQCRNKPYKGHQTCFGHTVRTDMMEYSCKEKEIDSLDEELVFCSKELTVGRYKGFRCGNPCEEGTILCTFHSH